MRYQGEKDKARMLQVSGSSIHDLVSFESCRSSVVDGTEEVSSESSRKMQDKEETTPEALWAAVAGREGWRLEPEGETETPKVIVWWNEAEGVPVNPDGEGHREQARAKSPRREREAPGEEGEEAKAPKRKVIRVESEETQDYVKGAMDLSQEDAEEISFVPSAIGVPPKPLFRCDNRCSEKAISFWQFASVVVEDGKESYTTSLCQQCYN